MAHSTIEGVTPTQDGTEPTKDNFKKESGSKASKVCRICGAVAINCNFGVISCESCKAFFRRNAHKRSVMGECKKGCKITKECRTECKRCRLDQCFREGMDAKLILNEKQLCERRRKIHDNKERKEVKLGELGCRDSAQTETEHSAMMPDVRRYSEENLSDPEIHKKIRNRLKQRCFTRLTSRNVDMDVSEPLPEGHGTVTGTLGGGFGQTTSPNQNVRLQYSGDSSSGVPAREMVSMTILPAAVTEGMVDFANAGRKSDSSPAKAGSDVWLSENSGPSVSGNSTSFSGSSETASISPMETRHFGNIVLHGADCSDLVTTSTTPSSGRTHGQSTTVPDRSSPETAARFNKDNASIEARQSARDFNALKSASLDAYAQFNLKDSTEKTQGMYVDERRQPLPMDSLTLRSSESACVSSMSDCGRDSVNTAYDRRDRESASPSSDKCHVFETGTEIHLPANNTELGPNQELHDSASNPKCEDFKGNSSPDIHPQELDLESGRTRPDCSDTDASASDLQSPGSWPSEPLLMFQLPFASCITEDLLAVMEPDDQVVLCNLRKACAAALDKPMNGTFIEKPNVMESFNQAAGFVPMYVSFAKRLDGFKKLALPVQIELVKSSFVFNSGMYFIPRFDMNSQTFHMAIQSESSSVITEGKTNPDFIIDISDYNQIHHMAVHDLNCDTVIVLLIISHILFSMSEELSKVNADVAALSQVYMDVLLRYVAVRYPNGEVKRSDIENFLVFAKYAESKLMKLVGSVELSQLDPMLQEVYG